MHAASCWHVSVYTVRLREEQQTGLGKIKDLDLEIVNNLDYFKMAVMIISYFPSNGDAFENLHAYHLSQITTDAHI